MVEPSKELQLVFEKSINDAKKLMHEYVTVEHILFAMLCEENFENVITGYGADPAFLKSNLENHLKSALDDIKVTEPQKPKKTQAVERVLNRAFTQVLFSGRSNIELSDVFISILSEKKSIATYWIEKSGITKGDATYYEVDTTINGIKVQYATIDADNATLIDETDSAVFAIEPGAKSNSTGGKQVAISTAVEGTTIKLISGTVEKGLSATLDLDYVQVSASRPLASGATAVITYTDEDYLASGASSATSKENLEVELNVKF